LAAAAAAAAAAALFFLSIKMMDVCVSARPSVSSAGKNDVGVGMG
jgi:hypothetical protein